MSRNAFLFSEQEEPDAWLIVPEGHPLYYTEDSASAVKPYDIQHQYGCVGCSQFHIRGRLVPIDGTKGKAVENILSRCGNISVVLLEQALGLEVDSVLGEGLAKLRDGRYVATNNCD